MTDETEYTPLSRTERAVSIRDSAKRLARFCEIDAPEVIIEMARHNLLRKLVDFPVNADSQEANLRIRLETEVQEQKFLMDKGYYDDVAMGDSDEHDGQ